MVLHVIRLYNEFDEQHAVQIQRRRGGRHHTRLRDGDRQRCVCQRRGHLKYHAARQYCRGEGQRVQRCEQGVKGYRHHRKDREGTEYGKETCRTVYQTGVRGQ